jgi:predicted dehydrogenase
MTLRVALIGAGAFAHEHAASIQAQPGYAALIAAVDPVQAHVESFCARFGIPAAYTNTTAMLKAEQPDVVAICSPPFTHLPLAVEAMRAGAHVVCEKPLALSLAELDALAAAEAETGRMCAGIFQWRYGAAARHVKALIGHDAASTPRLAVCSTLWYRDSAYYTEAPWRARWAAAGGGVALTMGIHAMDMTLWMMGDWSEVRAITACHEPRIEVETVALAHVRFASGALGSFINSTVSPAQESTVRLDMPRLTVELRHLYRYDNADWRFTAAPDAADDAALARWRSIAGDAPGALATQWAHLLADFAAGRAPETRPDAVRPTYEFIASLYKSAAAGIPVQRGDIQPGDPFYDAMHGSPVAP